MRRRPGRDLMYSMAPRSGPSGRLQSSRAAVPWMTKQSLHPNEMLTEQWAILCRRPSGPEVPQHSVTPGFPESAENLAWASVYPVQLGRALVRARRRMTPRSPPVFPGQILQAGYPALREGREDHALAVPHTMLRPSHSCQPHCNWSAWMESSHDRGDTFRVHVGEAPTPLAIKASRRSWH